MRSLYAHALAEVVVEGFIEFVDYHWYKHAKDKLGDGRDFIRLAGLHRSGLPRIYEVADYLDACADFDEFPDHRVISKTLLPRRR